MLLRFERTVRALYESYECVATTSAARSSPNVSLYCSAHSTPSADFCRTIRTDRSTLSRDYTAHGRSPEVSSTAFRTQPPDLQPALLMDVHFMVNRPLVQRGMPHIRFLSIGSCICSTLLSDPTSR